MGKGAFLWPGSVMDSRSARTGPTSSVVSAPRICIAVSCTHPLVPEWPSVPCAWLTASGPVVFPLRGYLEIEGVLGCCRLSAGKPRDVHVGSTILKTSMEGYLG